jgi:NAD(P)-dependent dehydrogenase (short-subunit alcohol dehydrogenase family)
VNAAWAGGIGAVPNLVACGAGKHGVAGMTRYAAIEYRSIGCKCDRPGPGAIMPDMVKRSLVRMSGQEGWEEAGSVFVSVNPMKRFGQLDEVATWLPSWYRTRPCS